MHDLLLIHHAQKTMIKAAINKSKNKNFLNKIKKSNLLRNGKARKKF